MLNKSKEIHDEVTMLYHYRLQHINIILRDKGKHNILD